MIENLQALGITMVIVSHQMVFFKKAINRIMFFKAGEILEDTASSDFFSCPATEASKQF